MINIDENKKLSAQIASLAKKSVNYFDVEEEFFLIDSNNLSQVHSQLYGYSIQRSGIYEADNLTPEAIAGLDGHGCYVYVEVKDGQITIKQDMNGCWGIYLFRHGDYFALSNSFFRLLDHVKFHYPLTVNMDYCYQYLTDKVCSHAYLETAVNEIKLIERNAIVRVDIKEKNFHIDFIDYREHSVPLDSEKAINVLDNWFEFWSNVLCGVAKNTRFFKIALSGGFDTRISLSLALNSGIDLTKIRINSSESTLHTFSEDYKIASKIAEHYGFELNRPFPESTFLRYSLADTYNIETHSQLTFHSLPEVNASVKNIDKFYSLDGSGGELIRGNWLRFNSWKEFVEGRLKRVAGYSGSLSKRLAVSLKNSLESAGHALSSKYNIEDDNSAYIQQYLYHDVRARNHFGKACLIRYLKGTISLQPVFDPGIQTLRFDSSECPDYQMLVALIFARYAPDLLKFPFQGGRSIAPATIEFAKKINERFPLAKRDKRNTTIGKEFCLQPRDLRAEKILSSGNNNPKMPSGFPGTCLKATFESTKTFKLFTSYFDEELYQYAKSYYDTHAFGRIRPLYAVVAVTKVLEDVEFSQRNPSA